VKHCAGIQQAYVKDSTEYSLGKEKNTNAALGKEMLKV
jgi:hypothetical protein